MKCFVWSITQKKPPLPYLFLVLKKSFKVSGSSVSTLARGSYFILYPAFFIFPAKSPSSKMWLENPPTEENAFLFTRRQHPLIDRIESKFIWTFTRNW